MALRKNSTTIEQSIASTPGQTPEAYSVYRATLVLYDGNGGGDLEVTADGVDTVLEILQGSSLISDLSNATIPGEPSLGTPEHDEWEGQWGGLKSVPSNGQKVTIRATIEIECYEKQE